MDYGQYTVPGYVFGSESSQSLPLLTYPLVGHAEICTEGLPYPSPSASKYRVACVQHELVTEEDPSLQSSVAIDDISPNLLLPASGASNNCSGFEGQPSASESSVHTAPVFIDAPVAKILTELVPNRFIVPVIKLALLFMVIDVSVMVSVAVLTVDASEGAISVPSTVKESMEQTELATLTFPIAVMLQDASTDFGARNVTKIKKRVEKIYIFFIII